MRLFRAGPKQWLECCPIDTADLASLSKSVPDLLQRGSSAAPEGSSVLSTSYRDPTATKVAATSVQLCLEINVGEHGGASGCTAAPLLTHGLCPNMIQKSGNAAS